MIRKPCRDAADSATRIRNYQPSIKGLHHNPDICRDHAIQPHGCGCQHGQRAATEGNEVNGDG